MWAQSDLTLRSSLVETSRRSRCRQLRPDRRTISPPFILQITIPPPEKMRWSRKDNDLL